MILAKLLYIGHVIVMLCVMMTKYMYIPSARKMVRLVEISDGRLFNVDIEDIQFKDPPEPERGITHLILSDKQYISLFTSLIKTYEDSYTIIDNKDTLGFVRYLLIPTKCPIIINWNWEVKSQTRSVKMISGTGR